MGLGNMMAVNRGARGWEKAWEKPFGTQRAEPVIMIAEEKPAPVVDLVLYEGVWMTREDRLKCKRL